MNRITSQQIEAVSEGTFESGHLIRGYRDACLVWPAAPLPDGFDQPVRSDIPTLLLSGSRDPVTPDRFADEVAEWLRNSLTVVVPGAGHGVAGRCVETLQLVESGSVEGARPVLRRGGAVAIVPAAGRTTRGLSGGLIPA